MHIFLIGDEVTELARVRCYTDVWAYFLPRALRGAGVNVSFAPHIPRPEYMTDDRLISRFSNLSIPSDAHVLSLGLRYFSTVPQSCRDIVREKAKRGVAQLYDGYIGGMEPIWTFTVRDVAKPWHWTIGWAADPELCRPSQGGDAIRILIDHTNYAGGRDETPAVLASVNALHKSSSDPLSVRLTVDGGFRDWVPGEAAPAFHRDHVSYEAACWEYSRADVFLVTHRESVGLVALECAMAGALIVAPSGFIPADLLAGLHHVEYEPGSAIPWGTVLRLRDRAASRERALKHTWANVARRIVEAFGEIHGS